MLKIIAAIGGIQALTILVTLVRSKIVAVLLGPEGVGIISVIDQVVQLAAYYSLVLYVAAATLSFSMLVARSRVPAVSGEVSADLLQAVIALSLSIGLVLNPANGLFLTPLMNRNSDGGETQHSARVSEEADLDSGFSRHASDVVSRHRAIAAVFPSFR